MMLSGKSTVGRLAATAFRTAFVDADEALVERTGSTIADWFELGEPAFRAAERQTMRELLSDATPRVIAAGGGAFEEPETRALCLDRAFVVYLAARLETLVARHTPEGARPLLDPPHDPSEVLGALLSAREPQYARAHATLAVDGASPQQVVEALEVAWAEHRAAREAEP